MAPEVVVVGGGLAGLAAARRLARNDISVTVFENNETLGGRVRSRRRDGFILDRGFQVLFTAYPSVRRELDLDALSLRAFPPGAVLARPGQRSVLGDPLRDPSAAVATVLNREITIADKLRVLLLRMQLGRRGLVSLFQGSDTTIDQYLKERGFSTAFRERFAGPFYGGITLDRSLSTSKRVFEYTFRVLGHGKIAVPAAGMGAITDQLAQRARQAGATLVTGQQVETVTATASDGTVTAGGETITADAVIVATDAPTAQDLTGIDAIPTTMKATTTQYYRLPPSVAPENPRLHLNVAGDTPNHVVPFSAVAPEYGRSDAALLGAVFLGERDESDSELAAATAQTLESWYPERSFEDLEVITTDRIEHAQFAQPPGIHDELPAVDAPSGRCYLAGEYTEWSSIEGALRSGTAAATSVRAAVTD